MKSNDLKWATYILFAGILLIIICPALFSQLTIGINFLETGQIGDTIGGITAPISSLVGSILVFFALKAQIEANYVIQQQILEQKSEEDYRLTLTYLSEQVKIIKEDINGFRFFRMSPSTTIMPGGEARSQRIDEYTGVDAIQQLFKEFTGSMMKHGNFLPAEFPKISEFSWLLYTFRNLLESITDSNLREQDRKYLLTYLQYQYLSKIAPQVNYGRSKQYRCPDCSKFHDGIPADIEGAILKIEEMLTTPF